MKKLILLYLVARSLSAQTLSGSTLTLNAPSPAPVTTVGFQATGAQGNGQAFYWIIAKYPSGNATPAMVNAVRLPNILNGTTYVTIYWTSPSSLVTGYDVLKTSTGVIPSGNCNCVISTAQSGNSYADQGGSLSSYTLNTQGTGTAIMGVDNLDFVTPRFTFGNQLNLPWVGTYYGLLADGSPVIPSPGIKGRLATVLDGPACTGGGGTTVILCIDTGVAWISVSATGVAGVSSFNGRTGGVSLTMGDVTTAIGTGATAQTNLGLGTAAIQNIGTSGANVPLLSTANTWSLGQTFLGNIISSITGLTQCVHAGPTGLLSGTGVDCGSGGGGSSIFTSYKFGNQTAITGNSNYVQTTYPSMFTTTQTGAGTSGSPFVDAITLASQTQNLFFASPNGSSGAPTFRAIVAADVPTLNQNTTGTAATITGLLGLANTPLTTTQDILYDNGGILARLPIVTSGNCLGNTGGVWASLTCTGGGGSGTVTVVGAGSLTSTALVTGGGTTTIQTPSATTTLDSSGNLTAAGYVKATTGFEMAPGTPALLQGVTEAAPTVTTPTLYFDSTNNLAQYLNASSVETGTMVVPAASRTANQFVTNIALSGVATTAAIASADLPANPNLNTNSSLSASTGSGLYIPGTSLTAGKVYYVSSGGLALAESNVSTTIPGICIATSTTACSYSGVYRFSGSQSWTVGNLLYVSDSSAGALVTAAPTTSGHFVQLVGVALANDTILIMPSLDVGGIQ